MFLFLAPLVVNRSAPRPPGKVRQRMACLFFGGLNTILINLITLSEGKGGTRRGVGGDGWRVVHNELPALQIPPSTCHDSEKTVVRESPGG